MLLPSTSTIIFTALAGLTGALSQAATLQVGPGKPFAAPCQAFAAAEHGDTIEIAATTYKRDVCLIRKNNLHIKGVGGRAIIDAAGKSAQDKAAWVTAANNLIIENIEFKNAYSTAMNGAGIRVEGANLTIRNCRFYDNQMGILTTNNLASDILIEYSEFGPSKRQDGGLAHNIYISNVNKFTMRYSYSHHSSVGQIVKSRARENHLLYNRFSSESTGSTSYEISLPNGGLSYVIGNFIQQGPKQQNIILLTYLEEGARPENPDNRLFVINNTFVNDHTSGLFIKVAGGAQPATIMNNIFAGPGRITDQGSAILSGNVVMAKSFFANAWNYDYRLVAGAPAIDAGVTPPSVSGLSLAPDTHYVHRSCAGKRLAVGKIDAGAYEFGGAVPNSGCMVSPDVLTAKVVLSSPSVVGGSDTTDRVVLNGAAPATGALVMLSSSDPSIDKVPVSVFIPAGEITASFLSSTAPVATATVVTTTADYGDSSGSDSVTVTPGTGTALSALTLDAATYSPNQTTVNSSIRLTSPAPSGGAVVLLSTSNSTIAAVPASVSIPAGATSATFTVTTTAKGGSFTVTASYDGAQKTASASVSAPAVPAGAAIYSVGLEYWGNVNAGITRNYNRVTLMEPAPAGGAVVRLQASNGAVSVPGSITIPAGSRSATFPFTANMVASDTAFSITASSGGTQASASGTVTALKISALVLEDRDMRSGQRASWNRINLNFAPASGPITVKLTTSNPGAVDVPTTVTIPAGALGAYFRVQAQGVALKSNVTITATYNGSITVSGSVSP